MHSSTLSLRAVEWFWISRGGFSAESVLSNTTNYHRRKLLTLRSRLRCRRNPAPLYSRTRLSRPISSLMLTSLYRYCTTHFIGLSRRTPRDRESSWNQVAISFSRATNICQTLSQNYVQRRSRPATSKGPRLTIRRNCVQCRRSQPFDKLVEGRNLFGPEWRIVRTGAMRVTFLPSETSFPRVPDSGLPRIF